LFKKKEESKEEEIFDLRENNRREIEFMLE
jgi:hypothetical protein